ncbi:flagellar hook assembly protein FlgD [Xylophilus sp. ASV27]|uniref:flagellar hook assembly protein FlgD n=1 Tax=Xylophilus sp. ASV27 TaxID=2795129 RepID=UPI0018EC4401|nr:flagellar hook capping FlgD N-terminal domain-containing protein [Xylophilus sp. ASV27]
MSTSTVSDAANSGNKYTYTPTTSGTGTGSTNSTDMGATQDRFLKLLVAQLTNQDPMNPMDNAQMTTQIAQINTVTGIQQLNTTVSGLATQLAATIGMQAGMLVGRTVEGEGNTLAVDPKTKLGTGAFELDGQASSVVVSISTASGKSLGSINLGTMAAGAHDFSWDSSSYSGDEALMFSIEATNKGAAVTSTPLTKGLVTSVGSDSQGALTLTLNNGAKVPYSGVKSIS